MNEKKKKKENLLDDMQSLLGCFFSDLFFFSQSTIFIWTDFNFQGTH